MGTTRILVVDDEPRYVRGIQANLEVKGYEVLIAYDGQSAVDLTAREQPDLILMDVRMPRLDGYEACRRLREFSTAPVIMLTAMAETADKVKGLQLGADDYITKPFGAEELIARVQAVLRRAAPAAAAQSVRRLGELSIDFARQQAYLGDREVKLTATEYRLLCEFMRQAGQVLSAEHLLERVWGLGSEGEDRLLWRAIHRLRQKIEPDPTNPQYLHTKPGGGYILAID